MTELDEFEIEKRTIANHINNSAHSGQYTFLYQQKPSNKMMDLLKEKGYKVTQQGQYLYLISWK